jgi:hypothetical protein
MAYIYYCPCCDCHLFSPSPSPSFSPPPAAASAPAAAPATWFPEFRSPSQHLLRESMAPTTRRSSAAAAANAAPAGPPAAAPHAATLPPAPAGAPLGILTPLADGRVYQSFHGQNVPVPTSGRPGYITFDELLYNQPGQMTAGTVALTQVNRAQLGGIFERDLTQLNDPDAGAIQTQGEFNPSQTQSKFKEMAGSNAIPTTATVEALAKQARIRRQVQDPNSSEIAPLVFGCYSKSSQ